MSHLSAPSSRVRKWLTRIEVAFQWRRFLLMDSEASTHVRRNLHLLVHNLDLRSKWKSVLKAFIGTKAYKAPQRNSLVACRELFTYILQPYPCFHHILPLYSPKTCWCKSCWTNTQQHSLFLFLSFSQAESQNKSILTSLSPLLCSHVTPHPFYFLSKDQTGGSACFCPLTLNPVFFNGFQRTTYILENVTFTTLWLHMEDFLKSWMQSCTHV